LKPNEENEKTATEMSPLRKKVQRHRPKRIGRAVLFIPHRLDLELARREPGFSKHLFSAGRHAAAQRPARRLPPGRTHKFQTQGAGARARIFSAPAAPKVLSQTNL
jgi:hypothetical protein